MSVLDQIVYRCHTADSDTREAQRNGDCYIGINVKASISMFGHLFGLLILTDILVAARVATVVFQY